MNRPCKNIFRWALASVAMLALSACGGGDEDPAPQTVAQRVTFTLPGEKTFGDPPVGLAALATSGLPVTFTSLTPLVCTVSSGALTLIGAGACTVRADQSGNATFAAAAPVLNTIAVATARQEITFVSPGRQTLGTGPVALTASSTSGLLVSFTSTTPAVCAAIGTSVSLLSAGFCTVQASQPGDVNHSAADLVLHTFEVEAGLQAQSIVFASPGNQTLATPPAPLSATATSGLPVTLTSMTPGVCTVDGTALTLLTAGVCTTAASQGGSTTFAAAEVVMQSVTVSLASQAIVFTGPRNQTLGTPPPALSATASSGLPVSFSSTTPAVCTVAGTTLALLATGTCAIQADQAGNATYAAAPTVTRSITVAAAPLLAQSINFTSPGNQTLGTLPAPLVAAASSGLPVSFVSTTPSICTVSGTTLTLVAAGSCAIQATQAGSTIYAAATAVTRSITVAPAPLLAQSITFAGPGNQTLGTPAPALSASASSGLQVSLSSTTPAICTVSGTTLTLVATGNCSIQATQAGDATYAEATTVSRTFSVAAAAVARFGNGGFEDAQTTVPSLAGPVSAPDANRAQGWITAASGYSRSTDRRSGAFSARLAAPAFSAAVMLQNSLEHGGRPPLVEGASLTLRFWAKGTAGATGNVLFALRYLDGSGVIKANSQNQFFQGQINPATWTQITYNLGPVPAGAVAAFIEFSQSIGPIGVGPAGEDWFAGEVFIDDLSLE